MTKQSVPRLRSVKFKNGGEVRLIQKRPLFDEHQAIRRDFDAVVAAMRGDIVGYAIVAWDSERAAAASVVVGPRSTLPAILVPDFVREHLQSQKTQEWTIEAVMTRLFGPSKPDNAS